MTAHLTRNALSLLRHSGTARRLLMHAATRAGSSLVLCYHRVAPSTGGDEAIEPIPPDRFAEQMQALKEMGDVLGVAELLARAGDSARPAFAVTFDDDDASHVRYALPILRDLGIPATFFLSGRSLHGLGAYWWTELERLAAAGGLDAVRRQAGCDGRSLREVIRAVRLAGVVPTLSSAHSPCVMSAADIGRLAEAHMTIGFHSLHHDALPLLDDRRLAAALRTGRAALSAAAGTAVEYFAYPYGSADARVAGAARAAGYRAAFITHERPITARSDPFRLPRWQPGRLRRDAFVAAATLRLAVAVADLSPRVVTSDRRPPGATGDLPADAHV